MLNFDDQTIPSMRQTFLLTSLLFLAVLLMVSTSCRKNEKTDSSPNATLSFSSDTVFFDTVFPTVGSVTQRLIVYNPNKNKVVVSSILLAGGQASPYRINVDGEPAISASDIGINGNDSLFIFVRVTVDPQNGSTPFVVSDSIQFITNGALQQVKLVTWGRDAIFHRAENLNGSHTWDSLKAHVIYGSVRVDTASSLTIMPGTRVYLHKDAYVALSSGSTLTCHGTLEHPVRFQGDRLDPYYKDLPGQWLGIFFEKGSRDHDLNYTFIQNGVYGLIADSLGKPPMPMITMNNCIIRNMTASAIYAYGSNIKSENCVLSHCGRSCIEVDFGGDYDFRQVTIGNYWFASVRHSPSVYLSNYSYDTLGNKITNALTGALFANAIIYGSNTDEIILDSVAGVPFAYSMDHALLKTSIKVSGNSRFIECIVNSDPRFLDPEAMDLRIDSLSPAIGKGRDLGIPFDILGNDRMGMPDLGAYQWVPSAKK